MAVDADLSLSERLNRHMQTFYDLIGLDSRLLSDAERLNATAMYRIYESKELPELDDSWMKWLPTNGPSRCSSASNKTIPTCEALSPFCRTGYA